MPTLVYDNHPLQLKLQFVGERLERLAEERLKRDKVLDDNVKAFGETALRLSELIKRFHLAVNLENELNALLTKMADLDNNEILDVDEDSLQLLSTVYKACVSDYLAETNWVSPDPKYHYVAGNPVSFKPKAGGAKNAGIRTGVYGFQPKNQTKTNILIKQADPGELIAEFVGSKVYGLTMPGLAAECTLFRDETAPPNLEQVYVGSVYAHADKIQDAFQAAGYAKRGHFAGTKAKISTKLGTNQSLIHKVLELDKKEAGNSLAKAAANALWHGDHDFHAGNFVLVEKEGHKFFMKIDHGFSFFNFGPDLINVEIATAGRVIGFSRKHKKPEFFPTNHYWDILKADPNFFRSPHFLNAVDEICQIQPDKLYETLSGALAEVVSAYDANALEALTLFAQRIGMEDVYQQDVETLKDSITDFMVLRLLQRQQSLMRMRDAAIAHVEKPQMALSDKIQDAIDKGLQSLQTYEHQHKQPTVDKPSFRANPVPRKLLNIRVNEAEMMLYETTKNYFVTPTQKQRIQERNRKNLSDATVALSLLKEANDRHLLMVTDDKQWGLVVDSFTSHHGQKIDRATFSDVMGALESNLPQTRKMLGLSSDSLRRWMKEVQTIEKQYGKLAPI